MKLAVALLMLADLLLRGAAVPHAHASDAPDHRQSLRPHVHVAWHDHDDDHSHDHASPTDDHAVIYLDGTVMMFEAPHGAAAARAEVAVATPAFECPCATPANVACIPAPARPPGERAASIHDLLPHMLRI